MTCNGPTINNCVTCNNDSTLINGNTCKCNDKKYSYNFNCVDNLPTGYLRDSLSMNLIK